jgi:hypothetical protein
VSQGKAINIFRNVCIHAMGRKVTGLLMVTVGRRSKFMRLWMLFIPIDLNNANVQYHEIKGVHFYFDGSITNTSM